MKSIATTAFVTVALLFAPFVHADTCTTQYGGNTTCEPSDLTVNKQVLQPGVTYTTKGGVEVTTTAEWKDNMTTTDPTFAPGAEVKYKLIVTNSSGQTFNPVRVVDKLPPYLYFVSGSGEAGNATYDKDTRKIVFEMKDLIAGDSREVEITAKVVDADKFPSGKSLFCVVNVAEVTSLNRYDDDSAQACLQNGEVTVTKLPVAGFDNLSMLLPFAGVGLGGLSLLSKRNKRISK